jgi:choline dehydrogenase-like flavoprotein
MSENRDIPDVCIIGAGLSGGIMAYELASRGVKVVILEAGPRYDPNTRFSSMEKYVLNGKYPWLSDNPERDVYTNAGEIDYPLNTSRLKAVGGSTLHWGGGAIRRHNTDFKMKSLYSLADDWPISYEEIEPYYGKAEIALGVAGIADNPFASYRSTDFPLPPFPFNYGDRVMKKGCDKVGIVMHHASWARNSIPYQNRPACQAFATCGIHICPIVAQYTSEGHIRLAEKTGNAEIIPNANVLRINTDKYRRVISVTYAKPDKTEYEQRARVFVLAAHAVESSRLLLLSKSGQFPDGLANSSGMVGKNFMENIYVWVEAKLKERIFPYRIGFHTAESHQFCAPKKRDEMAAFKIEFENNVGPKPLDIASDTGNWGTALEKEVRESFGWFVAINAELEQLPDEKNSITLDPLVKDYFGNPAPRITYSISNYEKEGAKRAVDIIEKIFDALEVAEIIHGGTEAKKDFSFGWHHMGTCRMGTNPERSVVDPNLRTHDVDNLFIVGSSVFVTGGPVQPSLTIAALAIRAAEYISKKVR